MLSVPSTELGCDFMKENQFAIANDFSKFESHLHETKYSIAEYVGESTLMEILSQNYVAVNCKSVRIFRRCDDVC